MAAYDDLNVRRIFEVGIISVVVTAVTALAVQVLYYQMVQWQQVETAAESDYRRQERILKEQTDQISQYGVDAETGNITIPVQDAFKLMVNEKGETQSDAKSSDSNEA